MEVEIAFVVEVVVVVVVVVVEVVVLVVVVVVVTVVVLIVVVVGGAVIPMPQIFPLHPHSPVDVFVVAVVVGDSVVDFSEVDLMVVVLLGDVVDFVVLGFLDEIFTFFVLVKDTPKYYSIQGQILSNEV